MRLLVALIALLMSSIFLKAIMHYFPVKYKEEVLVNAKRVGIDPALLMAVIRVESSFNPYAVSPAGAIGLTQVMPHTAKWVSSRLGVSGRLDDPSDNIRIGSSYLRYLIDKYKDLEKALKAYNIGPKAYELGMREEAAERYLRRVEIAYKVYKFLYRW